MPKEIILSLISHKNNGVSDRKRVWNMAVGDVGACLCNVDSKNGYLNEYRCTMDHVQTIRCPSPNCEFVHVYSVMAFTSLSFDSSSTFRLTLGMVSTVIPSTQTLLKNQKYALKLGADGRSIFTLLIL